MADYDKLYDYGKDGEYINTVCEIPKGSMNKIEYDRQTKTFILDRVEPAIFAKPVNYGFIPRTLDEDGDALDTLILTDQPLTTGITLKARVVAVLNFEDQGEVDHKIVCVPEDDRHWGNDIKDLSDLSEQWKKQIDHHFTHYKDLKGGGTKVHGWGNSKDAWQVINSCAKKFQKL